MAKGLEKHQERQRKLSIFGKDLTRRSGACCELCADSGVALGIYEVPPAPAIPEFERCLFVCDACVQALAAPRKAKPERWRVLAETVWSDIPPAQVMAVRILRFLGKDEAWAREILDDVYLDESIEEQVGEATL